MKRAALLLALTLLASGRGVADDRHAMTGVVLKVDPATRTMMVSTEKVPGFMEAMAMPFAVRQAAMLDGLKPGDRLITEGLAKAMPDMPVNPQPASPAPTRQAAR